MICLGIESTAHTFGIGVVKDRNVLANSRDSYKSATGGIVPADAAQHHRDVAKTVLEDALKTANITLDDVDLVAVATGPGLPPCLLVGLEFAKTLDKPIASINHCIAHIEIGKLECNFKDPLVVYVSGGNTQVIAFESGKYRVFGETLDIGLGNALDKFGRELNLGMLAGIEIEKLAQTGKKYIELPYTVKGMDLTYSGLVTAALKKKKENINDLCYSLQETAFAMLTEVSERALAHTQKKEILLVGGVASNRRLQLMLEEMGKKHKTKFHVPKREFNGDNGAMIAYTGTLSRKGEKKIDIQPRWRTDEMEITWM
jgi:N6-L-threonylcarbamoyladenine synthase